MTTPLAYGVDYYPEQWSRDRWNPDLQLMKEAGVRVIRIAEFAWGLFEPSEGVFEWGWLDEFMGLMGEYELKVVMCTPTPTPPAWFTHQYPDCLRVDEQGRQMHPQTRRHACANHKGYRRRALRVTEKIAERYGKNEHIVAWQTDNEYGCHDTIRCTCANCEKAFQLWLRHKYESLDALNAAWGTNFWSQRYTDCKQIQPPRPAPADQNPGLMLDFYRFSSDTWVHFNVEQAAILRQYAPEHKVTHNLMIYFFHFDHYQLGQSLDFVSWDNYHHFGAHPASVAANHEIMWGVKEKPFWVIEQQVGQVNWSRYNPQFPDGMLTLKALQAVAHGADGILYFRWRQARFGAEMYHSGLLDHAARPTRAFKEAQKLSQIWDTLMDGIVGKPPDHRAAILFDFPSHWALEIQPHTRALNMRAPAIEPFLEIGEKLQEEGLMSRAGVYILPIYEALWHNNITTAIISPDGDLDRYEVIFAPQLHVATEAHAARLKAWVEKGGTLVLSPRSGFKNEQNALHDIPQPGPLTDLVGGTVIEFDTRAVGDTFDLNFGGDFIQAGVWAELWEPHEGTEVLATYLNTKTYFERKPAVLRKVHGNGQVITIGAYGNRKLFEYFLFPLKLKGRYRMLSMSTDSQNGRKLTEPLLEQRPVYIPILTPDNVEAVQRGNVLFLLNHTAEEQIVSLQRDMSDLLTGDSVVRAKLKPYGYQLLVQA